MHGRQWWVHNGCPTRIVKANNSNVVGHAETRLYESHDRSHGHIIVGSEYRRRGIFIMEEPLHVGVPEPFLPIALNYQTLIKLETVLF